MGQQQLLLLVLGVVIVGLAVVVGIEAFEEGQRKQRQDQTTHYMMDIAAKAQLWKSTPSPMGGGGAGAADDFSTFSVESIGMMPIRTNASNGAEVLLRAEYACIRVLPRTDRLRLDALNTDCQGNSWWQRIEVRGIGDDDITFRMRDSQTSNNGL